MAEIKERARTADQNALLHALLQDIARHTEWAGKRRTLDDWKALIGLCMHVSLCSRPVMFLVQLRK